MPKYPLDARFWQDNVLRALPLEARFLAAYLLTGPQTNRIGFFVLDRVKAASDLRIEQDSLEANLACLVGSLSWRFDESTDMLLMRTWWRYHKPGSPQTAAGYAKDYWKLPPSKLLPQFVSATRKALGPIRWPAFADAAGIDRHAFADVQCDFSFMSAHQELIAYFVDRWKDAHGGAEYAIVGPRDGKAAQRILEHVKGDIKEAKRLVDAYFEDDDPYMRRNGCPLVLLASASRLNKYTAALVDDFDREWEALARSQSRE